MVSSGRSQRTYLGGTARWREDPGCKGGFGEGREHKGNFIRQLLRCSREKPKRLGLVQVEERHAEEWKCVQVGNGSPCRFLAGNGHSFIDSFRKYSAYN